MLLRGWTTLASADDFAQALAALPGLRGIPDYLPAEPGREPRTPRGTSTAAAAAAVPIWPTNRLKVSGGYLSPEVLPHTECYYALTAQPAADPPAAPTAAPMAASARGLSLAPPRVVAFYCESPAWLGGETALFDGRRAFGALPSHGGLSQ